jgi:hypothetical protein
LGNLPKTVYLKGVQRSGTTLCEKWLFSEHFYRDIRVVSAGKHAAWNPEGGVHSSERLLFVVCKHPLPWVVSAHRWWVKFYAGVGLDWNKCTERTATLEEFVTKEHPMRHWSSLNREWMTADARSKLVVRYNEILENPDDVVRRVAFWIGAHPPSRANKLPPRRYNPDLPFDLEYYRERQYMAEITPLVRQICSQDADPEVMRWLGFNEF